MHILINMYLFNKDEYPLVHFCYLLMIAFTSRVHCAESGEESLETESVYSLKCHISHDVNHLHEGLKHVSNVSFKSLFL